MLFPFIPFQLVERFRKCALWGSFVLKTGLFAHRSNREISTFGHMVELRGYLHGGVIASWRARTVICYARGLEQPARSREEFLMRFLFIRRLSKTVPWVGSDQFRAKPGVMEVMPYPTSAFHCVRIFIGCFQNHTVIHGIGNARFGFCPLVLISSPLKELILVGLPF